MPKTQLLPNLQITFSVLAAPNTTGSDHLYNTLELLMMGIVLPETCWACNKICNKYHLLHLVGILLPHNNDDARSKSLQIYNWQLRSNSTPVTLHELDSFFRCTENNNMDKCHEILNVLHSFHALYKYWYKSNNTVCNMIKSQINNQNKF